MAKRKVLEEIVRSITRKLPAARPVFHEFMSRLKLEIIPRPKRKKLEKYRGALVDEDLPVLVSAIECGADYLVTGDKKHFRALRGRKNSRWGRPQVGTPLTFKV